MERLPLTVRAADHRWAKPMNCDPTIRACPTQVDIPSLKNKYREERDRRLRLDGQEQYAPAFEDAEALDYSDPHMPQVSRQAVSDDVDVVVLGGGWAGVLAGYHLRKAGVTDFRIIEQAGDFGGVWYWNRYPGLSCDNDSYCYLPLLEEMQFFPSKKVRRRSRDPRVLPRRRKRNSGCIRARCFTLASTRCDGTNRSNGGVSATDRGDDLRARFVIMAMGPINTPKVPRVPGLKDFQGKMFHTARWDYDYTGGNQREPVLDKLNDKTCGDRRYGRFRHSSNSVPGQIRQAVVRASTHGFDCR